jgi:protocatechuate 3,4-dioxygenase beta subunit
VSAQADKGRPATATPDSAKTVTITGQVLAADGKPAAGAKVSVCFPGPPPWLATPAEGAAKKPLHAVADSQGRFAIPVPRGLRDMGVKVVAAAKGMGPDWVDVSAHNAGKAVALRLRADDVTIRGRILDLEGRPVARAAIAVYSLERPADGGDLKAWIAAEARSPRLLNQRPSMISLPVAGVAGIPLSTTTDKAGRFRLAGFGCETVAHLRVRGEGVENTTIAVCTRDGKAALISRGWWQKVFPAARFELLLGPGKVVTGTVTEKGTGKPIAGAVVGVDGDWVHTDAKGRYRLTGLGKRAPHVAAARGSHHFYTQREVPDTTGAEPITIDFELQRGREIRGRLTDKGGRPVRGYVWYSARPDNPNLKGLNIRDALGMFHGRMTMADGAFRVLACPGPGYLAVKAEQDRFTCAEFKEWKGDANVGFNMPGWKGDLVAAVPNNLVPSHCHAIVAVEPSPDDPKSWTRDIVLDPGKTVNGTLVGPDGKPVAGALAFGLTAILTTQVRSIPDRPERINRLKGADFTVFGVNPREPRLLVFVHPQKNLGKLLLVRGDEKQPLRVRLEPLGTATGRLVDSKGKPAAGIVITPRINLRSIARKDRKTLPSDLLYFAGIDTHEERPYPTAVTADAKGHFTVAGLLPGIKFALKVYRKAPNGEEITENQLSILSLEAGKTKNLGDLKLGDLP